MASRRSASWAPRNSPEFKRIKHSTVDDLLTPEPSLLGKQLCETMQSRKESSLTDITLICPDGTRIPAMRAILATSSPFFEKLLTSDFYEKNSSEISISISGKMLSMILEFVYIGDCSWFRLLRSGDFGSVSLCNTTRDVTSLAFEAEYTCMEGLLSKCKNVLRFLCSTYPHLTTIVIQVMKPFQSKWCQEIHDNALATFSQHYRAALLAKFELCKVSCGVLHLDKESAEEVFEFLSRINLSSCEYKQIFLALLLWASEGAAKERFVEDSDGYFRILAGNKIQISDERLETARKIAGLLDLTHCNAKFLSEVVEPSGLVEPSVISRMYKKLSLRYEDNINERESRGGPRPGPLIPSGYRSRNWRPRPSRLQTYGAPSSPGYGPPTSQVYEQPRSPSYEPPRYSPYEPLSSPAYSPRAPSAYQARH